MDSQVEVGSGRVTVTTGKEGEPGYVRTTCADTLEAAVNQIALLHATIARQKVVATNIVETFYGQGIEVAGWHKNGTLESIDLLFDEGDGWLEVMSDDWFGAMENKDIR